MTDPSPFPLTGLTVETIVGVCRAHEMDAFRAAHGEHFLLQRGEFARDDRENWQRFSTVSVDKANVDEALQTPSPEYLVYHVPPSGKPPFPGWVTVGRAKNGQIIIDHGSISKLHALLVPDSDRIFSVYDARSTNGTAVNGEEAPRYGGSEKIQIESGDRLRFGGTHFLFMDAAALWSLMRDI